MPKHPQLFIDGTWRDASSGATHDVINAFTGEAVTVQAAASADDVDAAIAAAAEAFPVWAETAPQARRDVLAAAGALLAERASDIAATVADETGGTFGWGMFNVGLAAEMLRAAGDIAVRGGDEPVASAVPGLESLAVRRPIGVCVAVAPWNAPVILGTRAVAWPLAFGNTVVFKASEQSPRVHAAIVAACADAGLPGGVLNLLTNDPADAPEVVGRLIDDPRTSHINFTGSSRVGRIIASRAAGLFKRTLLELGGKEPLAVLDDADLDAAAAAANFGAFMNSGQICMSTERIVVEAEVADDFVSRLVNRVGSLAVGSPFDESTMVGPVVSAAASDHVSELIDDARAHGATIACGGEHDDALFTPTVVSGVTPEMRIYHEESFGRSSPSSWRATTTTQSGSPTTPNTVCPLPYSAPTSAGRARSPIASSPGSATSTGQPSTMSRGRRSGVSRHRAGDASARDRSLRNSRPDGGSRSPTSLGTTPSEKPMMRPDDQFALIEQIRGAP